MKRVKLTVSYDGTAYCGWQKQKNGVAVEEVINRALSELLAKETAVIGASRTDAGVHALGNVAVFDTDARMPAEKFSYALNQRLPEDIRILSSEEAAPDFHPRYHNSIKTYEYRIWNGPFEQPLIRANTYFFHRKLNTDRMKEACAYFLGEHDFAAFCSAHAQVRETTRTITDAQLYAEQHSGGQLLRFRISGNGFLYNMVRIIVGTLLDIGEGKYAPEAVKDILDGGSRTQAGSCAPAKGLTLVSIKYEEKLADELHVLNERMHYSLVQKDIETKQEAYLTIFYCREDLLSDLIVRMTKKSFRMGAKHFYVRYANDFALSERMGASKYNSGGGQLIFTAGDYRYVLDHEVRQMDRDLRADPPQKTSIADAKCADEAAENGLPVLRPLTEETAPAFAALYNKCFFSQPCTLTLTKEEGMLLAKQTEQLTEPESAFAWEGGDDDGAVILCGDDRCYLLYEKEQPVGFLMTSEPIWDTDALCIYALGVDGPKRRKGYAVQMLEWAALYAQSEGKKRLTLEVSSKNRKAVSLYFKNGFYDIRLRQQWFRADCAARAERRK